MRLFQVLATGAVVSNVDAAPADADLDNSSFGLWLDDTIGATIVRVKAKDSAGTVVTGAALAGPPATYTESNVTTDRSFNANSTTIDELADVLGTLIADLRARGVVA